jgi:hypothetical protein
MSNFIICTIDLMCDQKVEMGSMCIKTVRNAHKILAGKPQGKYSRHLWGNNTIKPRHTM